MPTPKKGPRLASSPAHERLMLANMATSLFQNGRITTPLPKAKRRNKSVVHILFTQIAEQMEQREGGYTRIVKIAPRVGDAAPAAVIELVTEPVAKKAVVKEAEAAAKVAEEEAPAVEAEATEAAEAVEAPVEETAAAEAEAPAEEAADAEKAE